MPEFRGSSVLQHLSLWIMHFRRTARLETGADQEPDFGQNSSGEHWPRLRMIGQQISPPATHELVKICGNSK
jgi:hypothetical protein